MEKKIKNRSKKLEEMINKHFMQTEEFDELLEMDGEQGSDDVSKFVYFKINSEYYAVDILKVLEVTKMTRLSYLPGVNQYILGVINLRGNIIPVIDTHSLFRVNNLVKDSNLSYIMIVEVGRSILGFVIDSVSQVVEIDKSQIEQPMVTLDVEQTEYITGETTVNEQLVAILDIEKLVDNEIFIDMD